MASNPLVSVVMPAYNSAKTIAQALDSCLLQTYTPLEIIVVDDGSTDNTVSIVNNYGEKVRLICQDNAGPGIARNTGIGAAQGEFIKFLDADDRLYPRHIEKCMAVFEAATPDVTVVYTRYQHVGDDGCTPLPDMSDPPLLEGDIFCRLFSSNSNAILTSAATVRKSALFEVGLFPDDATLRHSEDWDLFLRLAANYQYATVDEILLDYRWHDGGLTANRYAAAKGRLQVIQNMQAYNQAKQCVSEKEYGRMLGGRYHVLGIEAWRLNKRAEARAAFKQALQHTNKAARARRLYWWLTFLFPVAVTRWLNAFRRSAS